MPDVRATVAAVNPPDLEQPSPGWVWMAVDNVAGLGMGTRVRIEGTEHVGSAMQVNARGFAVSPADSFPVKVGDVVVAE